MSLVSMEFLVFVCIAAAVYYLTPRKYQWIVLLAFSYIYYASSGIKIVFFLLYTTLTTYLAGIWLGKTELSGQDKAEKKKRKKGILILTLILNFGMLGILKYTNFAIENINALFGSGITFQKLILPLGISFYTFQSMGYLIDLYWGRHEPERNPFRFALFVSFFPQLLQGPIGRFGRLAVQLYEGHSFDMTRIQRALQLILWGYFKKMVLADRAAVVVNEVFLNYQNYTGVTVLAAVLCYSVQLYADFSGGIDVVRGVAAIFGVELDENFRQPYFAVSITDFWHRWHITLGTWMKDYIFYPLSLSKGMTKFGKWSKRVFGKKTGRVMPVAAANIVVFLVVGIWHGAAWKYIVYGLYNGLIIAVSGILAQYYGKWFQRFRINSKSRVWHMIQIVRTFILVNISWYFDMAVDLKAAFIMMKRTVTGFSISAFTDGSLLTLGLDKGDFLILAAGCVIVFIISLLKENKVEVRRTLGEKPLVVRWAVYGILILSLPFLGYITVTGGGFIYAQF